MKKLSFYLMIILLSLGAFPTTMFAAEKNIATAKSDPKEIPAEVRTMLNRLDEIKAMDKSSLASSEKELRKEVREIKSQLRSSGNGLYLSVGAIIIIILLLILLL